MLDQALEVKLSIKFARLSVENNGDHTVYSTERVLDSLLVDGSGLAGGNEFSDLNLFALGDSSYKKGGPAGRELRHLVMDLRLAIGGRLRVKDHRSKCRPQHLYHYLRACYDFPARSSADHDVYGPSFSAFEFGFPEQFEF